jgi:DNA-binding beta-propeller fold protein YncE
MRWVANRAAPGWPSLRWALAIVFLSACGAAADGRGASSSTTPRGTCVLTVREIEPATSAAHIASSSAAATEPPQELATATPALPRSSPAAALPVLVNETTFGPSTPICVGEGLFVAEDGAVHTLGRQGDQACASVIDVETGAVTSFDPLDFPQPFGDQLQVSDPERARVYSAHNGVVRSTDCCGQGGGAVLMRPRAVPVDVSSDTALRFDERDDRLYLSYRDYDGQSWITAVDLVSGEKWEDVPVLPGPWALVVDEDAPPDEGPAQLVFADATALVILSGDALEPVRRLSLSHRPVSAVVDTEGGRLFVADAGGDVHVLDAITLAEEQRLSGLGTGIDLDPKLGRLYVGDRYSGGVSVFDLTTLKPLGRIPQPGLPLASPADGQVYILEEEVYQADGTSLALVRGRDTRRSGCSGCTYVSGLAVDPQSGTVVTTTGRYVDGRPLPIERVTIDPQGSRVYQFRSPGEEPVYSMELYEDVESAPVRQIDGLHGDLLSDPVSKQHYWAHDGVLTIIDRLTLEHLGELVVGDGLALLAVDGVTGSLYIAQGERLLRFE